MEQKTAVLLITHCGLLFDHAWYSAAPCTPSHSPHTFPPKNAARCDGLCNALHRPSQRAAMRDASHYVFCLNLAHDLPPCAPGLHSTLSAPSQSRPYSYQKCGRRDEGTGLVQEPIPAWSSLHLRQITHRCVLTACFQGRGICHREALLTGLQGESVAFQGQCAASHTLLCNVPRLSSP